MGLFSKLIDLIEGLFQPKIISCSRCKKESLSSSELKNNSVFLDYSYTTLHHKKNGGVVKRNGFDQAWLCSDCSVNFFQFLKKGEGDGNTTK